MQLSFDCLTAFCELPRAGESETGTLGGEAGQIDGAAVACGDCGERPIDVAAELGRDRNSFGRNKPFDPAVCREFDPRIWVVENAGRRRRDIRLDMLRPRSAETNPG